jgi:large subunit ribosomal protein L10
MNREQKAVAIEEIATHIDESHAIFAVDYRGISVPQVAELRAKLRDADATFKVVKNSLTERAADQAGAETLKDYLAGPTALTFVRGDVATAAKAIAEYAKATQLLPFKGGLMDGAVLDVDQLRSLSRLPSRDVLYGQLVGVVASPVGGLVRSLAALVGGLASALGQVQQKKESGEIPAGEAPAAVAEAPAAEETSAEVEAAAEEPAAEADAPATEDAPSAEEPAAEALAEAAEADDKAEPANEPAQENENQADASAQAEQDPADANPTKED